MKIGINLVGVSYNSGIGRYRDYKNSIDNFYKYIVDPLRVQGHIISFFIYTYDNEKRQNILNDYSPIMGSTFIEPYKNSMGGGDRLPNGLKVMSDTYIKSLYQVVDIDSHHDLDLIISTRFDINFHKNPFEEFNYDFSKCTFLWKEPVYHHMPLVNDTFIVFPRIMTMDLVKSIYEMEVHPIEGINIGMHNIYNSMAENVGKENINLAMDEYIGSSENNLYTLERNER